MTFNGKNGKKQEREEASNWIMNIEKLLRLWGLEPMKD